MLVYSYLQLHSTATEAEKAISFKNNRTTTALWALFAVEEQVKLFVAKQVLLVFVTFGCISGHSGFYLKEWSHKLCQL